MQMFGPEQFHPTDASLVVVLANSNIIEFSFYFNPPKIPLTHFLAF